MKRIIQVALLSGLLVATGAYAGIRKHNFTVSGPGGITGSGYFTYDDTVVANGQPVSDGATDNSIYYEFTIVGGIAGSGVTFTKADCAGFPALQYAPDFTYDTNFFNCDNGAGFTGNGVWYYTFALSDGASSVDVTFANTSQAVPTLPLGALGLLAGLLGWTGYRRLRRGAQQA